MWDTHICLDKYIQLYTAVHPHVIQKELKTFFGTVFMVIELSFLPFLMDLGFLD